MALPDGLLLEISIDFESWQETLLNYQELATKAIEQITKNVNGEVYAKESHTVATLSTDKKLGLFEEVTLPPGAYLLEVEAFSEERTPKSWTLAIREIMLSDRDIYSITLVAPGLTY